MDPSGNSAWHAWDERDDSYAHNILHAVNEPCLIMLWQILTKFSIDCPGQRSAPASGIIYYRPYSCEKKRENGMKKLRDEDQFKCT